MTNSLPTFPSLLPAAPASGSPLPTDAAALLGSLGATPAAEGGASFAVLLGSAGQPSANVAAPVAAVTNSTAVPGGEATLLAPGSLVVGPRVARAGEPTAAGSADGALVPSLGGEHTTDSTAGVPTEPTTNLPGAGRRSGANRLTRTEQEEIAQLLGPWLQQATPAQTSPLLGGPLAPDSDGAAETVADETADLSSSGQGTPFASSQPVPTLGAVRREETALPVRPGELSLSRAGAEALKSSVPSSDSSGESPVTTDGRAVPAVAQQATPAATTPVNPAFAAGALPLAQAVAENLGATLAMPSTPRDASPTLRPTGGATAEAATSDEADATVAPTTEAPTSLAAAFTDARAGFAPRATRGNGERPARPANLAADSMPAPFGGVSLGRRGEKNFLGAREETLTRDVVGAGIGVAQPTVVMPNTPSSFLERFAVSSMQVVGEAPSIGGASLVAVAEPGETLAENAARRAVAIVSAVADASAESALKAAPTVSLRFKVGQEDLSVRIELRGGEVRAEFRTDSPELQAAVAHEWRAVSASPESLLRTHEPVIVSNQGGSSLGGQGSSSQQQGQSAHSPFREPTEFLPRFARVAAQPASAEPTAAPAPVVSPLSQRLSAVA